MEAHNESASERQQRIEEENLRDLKKAMSEEGSAVAIWKMGENQMQADPATGGIVVAINNLTVYIENAQTRTTEALHISEIADVEIERP